MRQWYRHTPLSPGEQAQRAELWELLEEGRRIAAYPVDVRVGKPLDVLALKAATLRDIREYASFVRDTAKTLYASDAPRRAVDRCPACSLPTAGAEVYARINGARYVRCRSCGHVFTDPQPTPEALRALFEQSEEHASTYTDTASLQVRMRQVIEPKIAWLLQMYGAFRGGQPGSCLDVGAGGGHFVAGMRMRGIQAEGHELSASSRHFAAAAFGIDLEAADFLDTFPERGRYDVLTFWGLLEYAPEPRRFLEAAASWLDRERGMLVLEVPRVDCLGSLVQRSCPETVARHLEPSSHLNCFSDASVATLLHDYGIKPVAAWYFGMDAYESTVQEALRAGREALSEAAAERIPALQSGLDGAYVCDDLIVAAIPS